VKRTTRLSLLFALVMAACGFAPDYTGTKCDPDGSCGSSGSGYVCVNQQCVRTDSLTDAGASDGGTTDAGTSDAGTSDAGTPDAGTPDAGTPDAGTPDAGTPDAGTPDAGTSDAGTPDAGTPDGGRPDAAVLGTADTDGDGVPDEEDSCPFFYNPGQSGPQWASEADASTSYGAANPLADYNTLSVLGAPEITMCGDNSRAWAPKSVGAHDWLLVRFPDAGSANGVNIYESYPNHQGGLSFVTDVTLVEPDGTQHVVPVTFSDHTACTHPLALRWAPTSYPVKGVLISVFDPSVNPALYPEIDAVGLFNETCGP
jgi:hypothetical protein